MGYSFKLSKVRKENLEANKKVKKEMLDKFENDVEHDYSKILDNLKKQILIN